MTNDIDMLPETKQDLEESKHDYNCTKTLDDWIVIPRLYLDALRLGNDYARGNCACDCAQSSGSLLRRDIQEIRRILGRNLMEINSRIVREIDDEDWTVISGILET